MKRFACTFAILVIASVVAAAQTGRTVPSAFSVAQVDAVYPEVKAGEG
jgi:hypothetical protein